MSEENKWVYLEDFLLHYRNLIDFLGHRRPRGDDLHITRPNDFVLSSADPETIEKLNAAGSRLWEDPDTGSDIIAKYLHHCTMKRVDAKCWPVSKMNNELEEQLSELERLLEGINRAWPAVPAVRFPGAKYVGSPACAVYDDDE